MILESYGRVNKEYGGRLPRLKRKDAGYTVVADLSQDTTNINFLSS